MKNVYSVALLDDRGNVSYLSVRDVIEWKTKRTAMKHCADILAVREKLGYVDCWVENQFGEIVK